MKLKLIIIILFFMNLDSSPFALSRRVVNKFVKVRLIHRAARALARFEKFKGQEASLKRITEEGKKNVPYFIGQEELVSHRAKAAEDELDNIYKELKLIDEQNERLKNK